MSAELDEHFFNPGPKRVLSLDGGGILGVIELAFLERIESLLSARHAGNPGFRLCDWFDLIGGTSTGAIIAAYLALGMSAAEVTRMYLSLGPKVFRRRRWRIIGLAPRYDAAPFTKFLDDSFGDKRLDSEAIRTGLAMVARRFDTGSPWLISNNPRAPYWLDPPDRTHLGNRHYRLANLLRASTAAPGFFRPQLIQVVEGEPAGLFIDGGLSPYNNPSLSLLMLSQAKAFGLQWRMGPENLSLISIGAGQFHGHLGYRARPPRTAGGLAMHALMDTLADGQLLTLTLLQWFGETPMPWQINSEIGDLGGEVLGGRPLLRFQRYDMPLEAQWLKSYLGMEVPVSELNRMRKFDNPAVMEEVYAMAVMAAQKQVQLEHLTGEPSDTQVQHD